MGQYSREGWWYYFLVAFAIKTPLPTLITLLTAVGTWVSRECRMRKLGEPANRQNSKCAHHASQIHGPQASCLQAPNYLLCLALPPLAFWVMALSGSFNIGYRHILPSLPFLYVLASWQIGKWANGKMGRFANLPIYLFPLLLLWLFVGTIAIAPHYLAFFNAIAGGPDGGYRYLVDSNLDWGQDLPGLKRYVKTHGIERIYLSWFGAAHPEAYDFPFHPLPGFWRFGGEPVAYGLNPYAPGPGTYAISASNLQGVAFSDHDLYAWFRERTPVAHIGHSILIYQVMDEAVNNEAVVLGVPLARLAEQERALVRRARSVRQYDSVTGEIVPTSGGYGFAVSVPRPELGTKAQPNGNAPYEDRTTVEKVWFIAPEGPAWGQVVRTGPGYVVVASGPRQIPPRKGNVQFGDLVRLLHYGVEGMSAKNTLTVTAQWLVERAPHRAAVSFAHLLDAQGHYVAGWDGLTAPATCWQKGDLIDQEYQIALPAGLTPGTYQVEIGWYDVETLERWSCYVDDELIGDRLMLPEVKIGS
jgi:hypothetical protein